MAVYQYFLIVLPRKGVKNQHGSIPEQIEFNWNDGFIDAQTEAYWNEVSEQVGPVVLALDKIVNRASWGNGEGSFHWKTYSETLDNDAEISFNEVNGAIERFNFRADLRERNLTFLNNMITLGQENNWLFVDRKGKLLNPDFKEIKKSILLSDAYYFLKDPAGFFEKIEIISLTDSEQIHHSPNFAN